MDSKGFPGQQGLTDSGSEFNQVSFIIDQALGRVSTMIPVKIVAVHGGGLGPAPTVDVLPLVKQMDGNGNATSHETVYGVSTTRNQGGEHAVINDPRVGDVGHMVVSHRDISSVKANKGAESNPGSFRRFDMADGVYHGAMLNQDAPKRYLHYTDEGPKLADDTNQVLIKYKNGKLIIYGRLNSMVDVVFLGGDPDLGHIFSPVVTSAGPSPYVKARIS